MSLIFSEKITITSEMAKMRLSPGWENLSRRVSKY
jgi:hypothetical protein